MSKLTYQLIGAITLCTLTVAIIVGGISLYRSATIITHEIEDKLRMGTEKYANEFSSIFNRTEGIVDAVAADVEATFDGSKLKVDPQYIDDYEKYLDDIIWQTIQEAEEAQGLYFTFNPALNQPDDEVWYARKDGEIVYIDANTDMQRRDFSLPAKDDMLYFFKPIWEKNGVWVPPYYDKDIQLNVISYSRAVYYEEILIGVVGADVLTTDTTDIVASMKLYESGYAFLLDETMEFIARPNGEEKSSLKKVEAQEAVLLSEKMGTSDTGILEYVMEGERKILGFSHLDNGWILAITQSHDVAFAPIRTLKSIMAILALVVFFVTVLFAAIFSTSFSKPIVREKGELEKRNREKDIMLTYQSRQAKMGEMVGNIAHQWKQPLNSINLILVNILDAYRYGELTEKKLENSVHKADKIVKKLVDTVGDFTEFLKPSKEKALFDVNESIELALNLMEESIAYNKIKIEFQKQEMLFSFGYPNEFSHVVFNILNNARDAVMVCHEEKRQILIETKGSANLVKVSITNKGNRIPVEDMKKIFEPYFTTKGDKEGTGLGLYMCKNIVEQRMKGSIELINVEEGVCCIVSMNRDSEGDANE